MIPELVCGAEQRLQSHLRVYISIRIFLLATVSIRLHVEDHEVLELLLLVLKVFDIALKLQLVSHRHGSSLFVRLLIFYLYKT